MKVHVLVVLVNRIRSWQLRARLVMTSSAVLVTKMRRDISEHYILSF